MSALMEKTVGVACRSCGASEAMPTPEGAILNVCHWCWVRFASHCDGREIETNETHFNTWLVRQLYLDMRRIEKNGISGRCEAITTIRHLANQNDFGDNVGFQCGRHASQFRDGRRVCWSHGTEMAKIVQFTRIAGNPYDEFQVLIAGLCSIDERFLQCVKAATSEAEAINDRSAA